MSVFTAHFTKGTHAARPAASAVPEGGKYACSDHGLVYESDGASVWSTWFDPGVTSSTSAEFIRDTIGTALVSGSGVTVTVDDAGDTITLASTSKPLNAQTGTSYILGLADAGKFVTMTNAGASTLTVPPNSSVAFPVGTIIEGAQLGAGQVTLTPGAGVTINATPGLKIAAQYGTFGLLKVATDTWLAYGRLSA